MPHTSVTKSLDLALSIYYRYLAVGKVPEMKSTGFIPEQRWDEFLRIIRHKELSRFSVSNIALPRPGVKSSNFERNQTDKSVHFIVQHIDFWIFMRKCENPYDLPEQWVFHQLSWQVRAGPDGPARMPPSIYCD